MKKIALTFEQMKELESLGLDIHNSDYYLAYDSTGCLLDASTAARGGEIVPAFTLQDIIDLLPHFIEDDEIGRFDYELRVKKDEITYESFDAFDKDNDPFVLQCYDIYNDCETLIDCAFEMLKWCKQNELK